MNYRTLYIYPVSTTLSICFLLLCYIMYLALLDIFIFALDVQLKIKKKKNKKMFTINLYNSSIPNITSMVGVTVLYANYSIFFYTYYLSVS